jgi:PHP family Zn ribbon phosphoesterase
MLKGFKADLHIHTCLSPCAELEITPSAIVRIASEKGLDIIAITDHNSAENVMAAQKSAQQTGITVFAGMEVTSSEEVHILALFEDIEGILKLQEHVYSHLMPAGNDPGKFGDQIVVNEKDEVLDFNKRLLISATSLTTLSIITTIHAFGGLSIASHIDREAFGVISQLGFIPDDLPFDALEISPGTNREQAGQLFKMYTSFAWISSSDAHRLNDIGKRTTNFFIKEPSLQEIHLALKNVEGRNVKWG